ncbi:MAG: hypothetical protein SPK59_05010, partial [Eubacteriales bacterium]|nr:hypothetical protein [Eubacteriales bacterium]
IADDAAVVGFDEFFVHSGSPVPIIPFLCGFCNKKGEKGHKIMGFVPLNIALVFDKKELVGYT